MGFALSDIQLNSRAFAPGASIPHKHSGEGVDASPQFSWVNAPAGTQSFAVICHDPDAPLVTVSGNYGFVHWVYYNIPASVSNLEEASSDFTHGMNDFGQQAYGGPMPPNGHGQHHYYFWVIALDKILNLKPGLTLYEFLAAAEANIIGMNRLIGCYQRD